MTIRPPLLALMALACACARHGAPPPKTMGAAPAEIRFAVLGDSQFNFPGVFERMVHEVNLLRPDFVIQVGDMIQGYQNDAERLRAEWRRFFRQIAPLTMPFYPVPGNHDVITPESLQVYGEVWGTHRYHYSFDWGPAHFIALDSFPDLQTDTIGLKQTVWLLGDLTRYAAAHGGLGSEELKRRSIFVFLHSPMWAYDPVSQKDAVQEWERIHRVLCRFPVRMVFAGHTHNYSWRERDGITYIVLNSSGFMNELDSRPTGQFHEFIHVSVRGRDIRCAVIEDGSVLPIDTVSEKERHLAAPYLLADRTIRIPDPNLAAISAGVSLEISNSRPHGRTFALDWEIPHGSRFEITPRGQSVTVAAESSATVTFQIEAPRHLPGPDLPVCHVSSTLRTRTGAVPRDWERHYRHGQWLAGRDPAAPVTAIALDADVPFTAAWTLFIPPTARAARRSGEIAIDGDLSDAAWREAMPITEFTTAEGVPPETGLEVRFLWDSEGLWFCARMEEPNPAGLRHSAGGDVPLVWGDDDFELFIDAGLTQRRFHRLFENCVGTRFSSRPIGPPDSRFRAEYESATVIGDDHWSIEGMIPWPQMGAEQPPAPGDQWGLNIWQHRQQSRQTLTQWSPMRNFPYEANRFGVLFFE